MDSSEESNLNFFWRSFERMDDDNLDTTKVNIKIYTTTILNQVLSLFLYEFHHLSSFTK